MVMDIGDLDGDGDIDAVIGAFVLEEKLLPPAVVQQWKEKQLQILYLENNLH